MANKKADKPKPKPKLFVEAISMGGRVIKVAEDNLDYCVELKARGRTIKDPHDLLKSHPKRDYIFPDDK